MLHLCNSNFFTSLFCVLLSYECHESFFVCVPEKGYFCVWTTQTKTANQNYGMSVIEIKFENHRQWIRCKKAQQCIGMKEKCRQSNSKKVKKWIDEYTNIWVVHQFFYFFFVCLRQHILLLLCFLSLCYVNMPFYAICVQLNEIPFAE